MKKTRISLAAMSILAAGLFAFNVIVDGSIKGTVAPPEGAVRAWAISGTDTLRADVANGAFEIGAAKPGTYTVIIEATAPFKNATKEGVEVKEGEATDLGEITLEQ
ncbi:MAG: carboxypeptidase regulatory-like domain-containing protein [Chitinophagaceae bacterium]|nr:carboxypeptidase regulatory-like domain-containing protein [Chitinophagaceae bacterium]MCW5929138.1 carboxypeptidase regulatory-like domain-containing protein [Chitinophagaceae bacterium]